MSDPPRLLFRDADEDDLLAAAAHCESPDLLLMWAGPIFAFPLDMRQARRHMRELGPDDLAFSVTVADDPGHRVAFLELRIARSHRVGRISRVLVHPQWRGKGICQAVISEVTRRAFEGPLLDRLELTVLAGNSPALRCYEGVGFRMEERLRQARRLSSGPVDAIQMALLQEEWTA